MSGRIIVVNVSGKHYNLGAHKCYDWMRSQHEGQVEYYDGDPGFLTWQQHDIEQIFLSVVFSWHAPLAREIALQVRDDAKVECGGPGMFALASWWKHETGLPITRGLDPRFETQSNPAYRMVFAARGCSVGCPWCIVPTLEGRDYTLNWQFQPAPILGDNNLSGLPDDFQEHIVQRYLESGVPLLDCNSGFEPRSFGISTYERWKRVLRGAWRFAHDEAREANDVATMMQILREEPPCRKRVYTLAGNEPISVCYQRILQVIEWGGEPYAQYLLPLNWLGDDAVLEKRARADWTVSLGRDFCRYVNRFLWRKIPISAYKPRKDEPPPFASTPLADHVWHERWQTALAGYKTFQHRLRETPVLNTVGSEPSGLFQLSFTWAEQKTEGHFIEKR